MLIVSQNKRKIINFENIVEIFLVECSSTEYQIQYQSKEHWYDNLGVYKKERAKQVLEELVYYKAIFEYYRYSPKSVQDDIAEDFIKDEVMFDTYEMPEE